MKVVKDINRINESITLVTTGDGTSEFPRVEALGHRYNGEYVLWFPERTKYSSFRRTRSIDQRMGGLSALEVIDFYLWKYGILRYLFIIDKEYFGEELASDIENKVRAMRITNPRLEKLTERSYCISCEYGSHDVVAYIAISGIERRIEEDIAMLIKLECGLEVEPEKSVIKSFLRERGIKEKELIKGANKGNLRRAFLGLTSTLEKIKRDYTNNII